MISKTRTMNLGTKLEKIQLGKAGIFHLACDDEYVCQNLKKANFSIANNFGEVVKKFKSTFLNN